MKKEDFFEKINLKISEGDKKAVEELKKLYVNTDFGDDALKKEKKEFIEKKIELLYQCEEMEKECEEVLEDCERMEADICNQIGVAEETLGIMNDLVGGLLENSEEDNKSSVLKKESKKALKKLKKLEKKIDKEFP